MKIILTLLLSFLIISYLACNENKTATGGLNPQQALSTFKLADGYKIELVAAEPMVSDPVAMEIDEYGNVYVVEMHGYPMEKTGPGTIKLLTDSNGDGMPDKSTVFADNLGLPTGIMKWKKGVLVVNVPDILYLEDTNGDGKADVKKVIITGLALTNPQHIANTPIFGLDGWIYVAHMETVTPKVATEFDDEGQIVRYAGNSNAKQLPRNADGRNIRFKPGTYELEMLSSASQYGQTFDAWGHQLCTENADHLFFEAIAARYLQRNPNLLVANADDHIADHGKACEVYPITVNPEHQLLTDVGVVTSSCGVTWYQGGLFPDSFNNITFIAEPVHNLVHADRITDKGASFIASRVYEKKEFLASADPWFRPVQFYHGPDGALYVLDYYRKIIEHPEWLSDEIIKSGNLYAGSDKGRIYRITPTNTPKINWCSRLKLGDASTEDLVKSLVSDNIWWRRNAQRLLIDRKDEKTLSLLRNLIVTATQATAVVHALWTLNEFNAIDFKTLQKALHHPVTGVRENAIRVAELHLKQFPQLENELLSLHSDADAKVRYQLLCTLGDLNDTGAEAVKQKLLLRDIEDKWIQIAALSSSYKKEYALLVNSVPELSKRPSDGKASFFRNCAEIIGLSQNADEIKSLIRQATRSNSSSSGWWQAACLDGLTKGISVKGHPSADFSGEKSLLLSKFDEKAPVLVRTASLNLLSVLGLQKDESWNAALTKAKAVATSTAANVAYRKDALQLIMLDKEHSNEYHALFKKLITPHEPESLQQAALTAYNKLSPDSAAASIIRNWKNLTYGVRDAAMNVFLSSVGNMNLLLDAVKKNEIQSTSISWPRMVQLMNNDDAGIRRRARELLAGNMESRDEVYKKYQPALALKGDATNGLKIFEKTCTACHQAGGMYGYAFGPDLASIRNRDAQFIMADILNPNRAIADRYEMWNIVKKNGEKLSGIISSETSAAITVRNMARQETVISRNDIKTMEASKTSAMPAGLEASVSVKEMADLIAFLKNIH
ncbi:MAG: hypothetical protein AVDCRST_MAG96-1708 [uncultured Segetibacter sp.]|uniref:Cytochrome c domain-containing protein n=1 Tax=uncultured Segetibacter sp. TaxID=481133 RepID=A0A6J4SCL2_9BACT|nr:MAG: hypothetical protein AVDCRST_MAG96-1708 [uncultured Segetibacter sp.]